MLMPPIELSFDSFSSSFCFLSLIRFLASFWASFTASGSVSAFFDGLGTLSWTLDLVRALLRFFDLALFFELPLFLLPSLCRLFSLCRFLENFRFAFSACLMSWSVYYFKSSSISWLYWSSGWEDWWIEDDGSATISLDSQWLSAYLERARL